MKLLRVTARPSLARRVLGKLFRAPLLGMLKALSEQRVLEGIEIWCASDADDSEMLFDRVGEALRILRDHDPVRFLRTQRHLRGILIIDGIGGALLNEIRVCALGPSLIKNQPTVRLAATIVHEATHARLRARGVPVRDRTLQREETLCMHEAAAFLRRVPGGGPEAERMLAILESELASSEPWFMRR